jgi:hypothetical protein
MANKRVQATLYSASDPPRWKDNKEAETKEEGQIKLCIYFPVRIDRSFGLPTVGSLRLCERQLWL